MSKLIKFVRFILAVVLIIFVTVIGSNIFVIIKINFTDSNVGRMYFTNKYFVKAESYEVKIESFKKFMSMEDWIFIENYYGTMIFRKGNLQKEVMISSMIEI